MASFEVVGFVKNQWRVSGKIRLSVAEYVQGRRGADGEIEGERMDVWYVFFPTALSSYLLRFAPGDLVVVKGVIHQATLSKGDKYAYSVSGESIKHFHVRDISDEMRRERASAGLQAPDVGVDDF